MKKKKSRKKDAKRAIKTRKVGRPTKKTEYTIRKLVSLFKLGVSDQTAIKYARISPDSFYRWYKEDPGFSERIDQAKEYNTIKSAQLIKKAIAKDSDLDTAKWYLEKKDPAFSNKSGNVNVKDSKVLVIPGELLEKHNIQSDNTS